MRSPCFLLLSCVLALGAAEGDLVDLGSATQGVAERHFRAELTLEGVFAHEHKGERQLVAATGIVDLVDGRLAFHQLREDRWGGPVHAVLDDSDLHLTDHALEGSLVLAMGEGEDPLRLRIQAALTPLDRPQAPPGRAQEGRFWTIAPEAQGRVATLSGTWSEGERGGAVAGRLALPLAPGRFDMGRATGGGIAFAFDLGTARQNWNHARLAQLVLPDQSRDLRGDGLAIAVTTATPRIDASVTVWVQEDDGSWYYVKDGVPLAAASNESVLRWEHFEEAEWVSPSNHMDEDFILDRSRVRAIGIGVVNPLGVGIVEFTLTRLALVPEGSTASPGPASPAPLAVSGRTMAVNDQAMIPAALIGGYHPDLPQRYRPGCQRILHFGLTGAPQVPRIRNARFGADDLPDVPALVAGLVAGTEPLLAALKDGFEARFVERSLAEYASKPPKDDKDARRRAEALAKQINARLAEPLGDGPAAETTTERMEVNRRLLHETHPTLFAALPPLPTEQFIIDCQGERLHPSIYVKDDNWETNLHGLGKRYAAAAIAAGHVPVMEFWNEPYLNWAERSRIHFNVDFYRQDLAVAGGPVTVKRADGRADVIPHFKWVKARDDRVSQTPSGLMVIDETAFSYWSGRGNGHIYDAMYRAHASGIKAVMPEAICVAGWGFRWHEDHWGAWDLIYKPTIDHNIALIDGIHEHHYQGDTTDMVGSYEVLTAYGVTAHGKWLRSYNTETNDLVDAPARGHVELSSDLAGDHTKNYRRAIYNLRDIVYCLYQAPAKAASRTVIHADHTWKAMDACYGFLADLRGRLVASSSLDPDLWVVAAIDGTDPTAPAPLPGHRLTVVVFNNHREVRSASLAIDAPTGTSFARARIERVQRDEDTWDIAWLHDEATTVAGQRTVQELELPPRSAWKIVLDLDGEPVDAAEISRDQQFSADILRAVHPGEPFDTVIRIPAAAREGATRAWLKLVVENCAPDEATCRIGDTLLALPTALTRDNGNRIVELPLDLALLGDETALRFAVATEGEAGFRVDMASIVIERPVALP